MVRSRRLTLEFCGESVDIDPDTPFVIGRDADYVVDDNAYLHRRFLEIAARDGLWWLANVGSQLAATLSDDEGRVQAWLSPGASLPVVFEHMSVRFSAGPTAYELSLMQDDAPFALVEPERTGDGTTTLGPVVLNPEQRRLIVALAEPVLRRRGTGASGIPTSAEAAARLGWPLTKFNRKLDSVCQKLEKAGVQGLHGDVARLASARRARLVEYALAVRLVAPEDLVELDSEVVKR